MTEALDSAAAGSPRPTLSLIVAAYNIADYIGPCLSSILDDPATDCEVIVVDDGSTDDTRERIATFTHDPRLRLVTRENGGLGAARNTGLDAARGAFIQFVDGDDWLEPGALSCALAAIAADPAVDLFVFDYHDIRDGASFRRYCRADFWRARNAAWNKLYRRTLIGDTRFDTDILYEDLASVRPWLAQAERIARLPAVLYNYRNTRPGSIMNSRGIARFFELFTAAQRCVARIEIAARRRPAITRRLGAGWRRRFYTSDVFVPGVIYWTQGIGDDALRHDYIRRFMARLPASDLPSSTRLIRDFGPKIALIAQCYRRGAFRSGDFLWRDLGRYRRRAERGLLNRLAARPRRS